MAYVTQSELMESVPYLRAMAQVETSAEIRAAFIRLADRYVAGATERQDLGPVRGVDAFTA
jgi:hypothetical protein